MTKPEIFKTLINILRDERTRRMMEFNTDQAQALIYPQVQEAGLTVLGMGMYALVVEHEDYPGRAFKVTTSRWDGFRAYAKYCKDNEGAQFLPVIHSIHERGNFAWYEMDKYFPIAIPSNGYEAFVSIKGEDLYTYAHAGQYASSEGVLRGSTEQIAIYETAQRIKDTFEKNFCIDIHTGNVMIDANGNVIITDPLGGDLRREIPVIEDDPMFD